jgi:DNA-binding Lrp family transcriptional regulator
MKEWGISMDKLDMELLNFLQNSFPVESRPFMTLGNQLGITEEEVIRRIEVLKENGYIRRIGGIFNSGKLGYFSTLCAMKVPENRMMEVVEVINSYNGVTHNYVRNHTINLWFTLIVSSEEKMKEILEDIKFKTKIDEILNLRAVKVFKVKTVFNMVEV